MIRLSLTSRARLAFVAIVAATTMAGCSAAGTAAITVDDIAYTDSDVQTATMQLRDQYPGAEIPVEAVVAQIVLAESVITAAEGRTSMVSQEQAKRAFTSVEEPSEIAVLVLRSLLIQQNNSEDPTGAELVTAAQEDLAGRKIELSSRYGSFDATTGTVVTEIPEWVLPEAGEEPLDEEMLQD